MAPDAYDPKSPARLAASENVFNLKIIENHVIVAHLRASSRYSNLCIARRVASARLERARDVTCASARRPLAAGASCSAAIDPKPASCPARPRRYNLIVAIKFGALKGLHV